MDANVGKISRQIYVAEMSAVGASGDAWIQMGHYRASLHTMCVSISPDGRFGAWASTLISIVGLEGTQAEPVYADMQTQEFRGCTWSPDSQTVVFAGRRGSLYPVRRVSAVGANQWASAGIHAQGSNIHCAAYRPIGTPLLAAGHEDKTVALIDGATFARVASIGGFASPAIALAWSASGTTLAACEMVKGTLHLLRVPQSGDAIERIRMFTAHTGRLTGLAFSPAAEETLLSSCYGDGERGASKVWALSASGEEAQVTQQLNGASYGASFATDGQLVFVGCGDEAVNVWRTATGKLEGRVPTGGGHVFSVAYHSKAGRLVVGLDSDTGVKIFRIKKRAAALASGTSSLWLRKLDDALARRDLSGLGTAELLLWLEDIDLFSLAKVCRTAKLTGASLRSMTAKQLVLADADFSSACKLLLHYCLAECGLSGAPRGLLGWDGAACEAWLADERFRNFALSGPALCSLEAGDLVALGFEEEEASDVLRRVRQKAQSDAAEHGLPAWAGEWTALVPAATWVEAARQSETQV